MKRIDLSHLHLRLPADSNFVEFANYAANSNIIALCKALFLDNKAYVLYGVESIKSTGTSAIYSSGAIYYNGEIYMVDSFSYVENQISIPYGISGLRLCIREIVTDVMYMSGDELPAYRERKMYPVQPGDTDPVNNDLRLINMVRLSTLDRSISINDDNQEGMVTMSPYTKHLLINMDIRLKGTSFDPVTIPITGVKIPNQFLGCVTLFKMAKGPGNGAPLVAFLQELKYNLFMFDGSICLTPLIVKNITSIDQCETYYGVDASFNTFGVGILYVIEFNHQIVAIL
jgi:hypothetical protein